VFAPTDLNANSARHFSIPRDGDNNALHGLGHRLLHRPFKENFRPRRQCHERFLDEVIFLSSSKVIAQGISPEQ
jgi:hypothetical protein